jgi:hypothetical protein
MSMHLPTWSIRNRLIAMAVIAVGFIAFLLVPLNTWLGVKVVATGDLHGHEIWDKRGRDMIWKVWWRARHLDGDYNETILLIGLTILLVAFIIFATLAAWNALSIPAIDETAAGE